MSSNDSSAQILRRRSRRHWLCASFCFLGAVIAYGLHLGYRHRAPIRALSCSDSSVVQLAITVLMEEERTDVLLDVLAKAERICAPDLPSQEEDPDMQLCFHQMGWGGVEIRLNRYFFRGAAELVPWMGEGYGLAIDYGALLRRAAYGLTLISAILALVAWIRGPDAKENGKPKGEAVH